MTSDHDPLPRRQDLPVLRRMPTRWHDNDQYGHVNNVVYYSYLDTAVNAYLIETVDADLRELSAIGVVVETGCRFLASATFPEELWVGLGVERLGGSSVTYRLAVFRGEAPEPIAVARFVHVYVDPASRRPSAVPTEIREAVAPLQLDPATTPAS